MEPICQACGYQRKDAGPRLLAMTAGMPCRASARANAEPIWPAPIMPMLREPEWSE
jgi:hypothetical protein